MPPSVVSTLPSLFCRSSVALPASLASLPLLGALSRVRLHPGRLLRVYPVSLSPSWRDPRRRRPYALRSGLSRMILLIALPGPVALVKEDDADCAGGGPLLMLSPLGPVPLQQVSVVCLRVQCVQQWPR